MMPTNEVRPDKVTLARSQTGVHFMSLTRRAQQTLSILT